MIALNLFCAVVAGCAILFIIGSALLTLSVHIFESPRKFWEGLVFFSLLICIVWGIMVILHYTGIEKCPFLEDV